VAEHRHRDRRVRIGDQLRALGQGDLGIVGQHGDKLLPVRPQRVGAGE
jgi:hypothetical protein